MSAKFSVFSILLSFTVLVPVYAVTVPADESQSGMTDASVEQRIEQAQAQHEQRLEKARKRYEAMRGGTSDAAKEPSPAGQPAAVNNREVENTDKYQEAYTKRKEQHEQRLAETRKRREDRRIDAASRMQVPDAGDMQPLASEGAMSEERIREYRQSFDNRQEIQKQRQAEARKRHEAMREYEAERQDAHLKELETRQAERVRQHEEMRDRALKEHDYLMKHHEEMLNKALTQQTESASRHEEMRKQAEARRAKMEAHRAIMREMGPEERREYLEANRDEIFQRPEMPPRRHRPAGPGYPPSSPYGP